MFNECKKGGPNDLGTLHFCGLKAGLILEIIHTNHIYLGFSNQHSNVVIWTVKILLKHH